jgi:hypothetical protein
MRLRSRRATARSAWWLAKSQYSAPVFAGWTPPLMNAAFNMTFKPQPEVIGLAAFGTW